MILFLIALFAVLIALTIGVVIEFKHQHEEHKLRKARKDNSRVEQQVFEAWLATKGVKNTNIQTNIKQYSAKDPL